jgi:hypothetical protein
MARRHARPAPTAFETLEPLHERCLTCGNWLRIAYFNWRTVHTLQGRVRLTLKIRRCRHPACVRYKKPYRPEAEGSWALPGSKFGLDVIAFIGHRRYGATRSVPEIHRELLARGLSIAERTVTDLLHRYEELVALRLGEQAALQERLREQGKAILAIDGLQPQQGQETLWVIRETLSGEVLLSRSQMDARAPALAKLLGEVATVLRAAGIPIAGVISDGQPCLRHAVAQALPEVPHQLCQFHYLREATAPLYEADRAAKKQLKGEVRGVATIERSLGECTDREAAVIREYCLAVRGALSAPAASCLSSPGVALWARLEEIRDSLSRSLSAWEGMGPKRGGFPS